MFKVSSAMLVVLFAAGVGLASSAVAQQGPVATGCSEDIASFCAGKEHGRGEVRACLNVNKDKVSSACKEALETAGPGMGKGMEIRQGK